MVTKPPSSKRDRPAPVSKACRTSSRGVCTDHRDALVLVVWQWHAARYLCFGDIRHATRYRLVLITSTGIATRSAEIAYDCTSCAGMLGATPALTCAFNWPAREFEAS